MISRHKAFLLILMILGLVSLQCSPRISRADVNKADANPLSPEQPYTVYISSQKSREIAEQIVMRLKGLTIDGFLLTSYNPSSGISTGVYAGVFKERVAAEALAKKLAALGIKNATIVTYSDLAPGILAYQDLSESEKAVYPWATPANPFLPESIRSNLNEYPFHKDYGPRLIKISDRERRIKAYDDLQKTKIFLTAPVRLELSEFCTDALVISQVLYEETLSLNRIRMTVITSKDVKGLYQKILNRIAAEKVPRKMAPASYTTALSLTAGVFFDNSTQQNEQGPQGSFAYLAYQAQTAHLVCYSTEDVPADPFLDFIKASAQKGQFWKYPELDRQFSLLPLTSLVDNQFYFYSLEKTDESFAEVRDDVAWTKFVAGCWQATYFINHRDALLALDIFDLYYPYCAEKEQQLFMAEQRKNQSGRLVPLATGKEGWFISNKPDCTELSFQQHSLVLALSSTDRLSEEQLSTWAKEQLRIW